MSLTQVSIESVQNSISPKLESIYAKLTDEQKQFINDNFREESYYNSNETYLKVYTFEAVSDKVKRTKLNALVKIGLCHYDVNSGWSIPYIPPFWTGKISKN